MFGSFILLFIAAGIVFFVAFWILHLIISLPVFWAEKFKWSPIWDLFSNLLGIYMLCAWPGFCVTYTRTATSHAVEAHWLYWLAAAVLGFLDTILSIFSQLPLPEPHTGGTEDAESHVERFVAVVRFRKYLFNIATLSFVVFLVWPALARFLYGWSWSWLF
jgi:hypothetical protein